MTSLSDSLIRIARSISASSCAFSGDASSRASDFQLMKEKKEDNKKIKERSDPRKVQMNGEDQFGRL